MLIIRAGKRKDEFFFTLPCYIVEIKKLLNRSRIYKDGVFILVILLLGFFPAIGFY